MNRHLRLSRLEAATVSRAPVIIVLPAPATEIETLEALAAREQRPVLRIRTGVPRHGGDND
jgi:hypothetical protein